MTPRLKSLELHGYKTFASRTDFEFPGVITAIVGPNGSGKSNIADALRWVLGEQSFSLLRGRKTEDMIFAGSEQRPRAGMASATITFDNSDGWLPIDYSEVSIARRAYRDGQNEYMLNGQRVRLKEISELLAQSGLAERTYTIIGQGLVDAALSLKPEERRRFFEEAAGIGLYRSRKEESLTRLETTRRNLDRVQDIISELEPRLVSLERQAKRAMEYDRVKADLRLLLREWYGFHWHKLIHEVAHQQEVARVHEARQQDAREKLLEVESRLEVKRKAVAEQRNLLNGWHVESAEMHRQREKINKDLAVLDEREQALIAQAQTLATDLARLEEEQANRKAGLRELEQEIKRLSEEYTEAKAQTESARGQYNARLVDRDKVDQAVRQERRKQVEKETRVVQLRARVEEMTHRQDSLIINKENLQAGLSQQKITIQNAQSQLVKVTQERVSIQERLAELDRQIKDRRKAIQEQESARQKSMDEIGKMRTEKSRLQAQMDVLAQAEQSSVGLNKGAKFILDMHRSGKLTGQYRALSSLIDVPAEYESAIAVLLGEYLDGIVISETEKLDEVLILLEDGEKGRAVFLPTQIKGGHLQHPITDVDVLGVAKDLIKMPEEVAQVINVLLGNTLIVRNRQAARRIITEVASDCRVVTLKGEVFWGSGAISAGQEGRSGVIARPRQKRELAEGFALATQTLAEKENQLNQATAELEAQRKALQADERQQQQTSQELNRVAQSHQQAVLAVEQSRQRLEWSEEQIKGVDAQMIRTSGELDTSQNEISRLQEEIRAVIESVRKLNRDLAELPLDEMQQQVGFWQTNAAVAERAIKEVQRRLEEQQQIIRAGEAQVEQILARKSRMVTNQQQTEIEKKNLFAQESQLNQKLDQLQQKITPAEQSLELMESGFLESQGDHLSTQQALTLVDRLHTQAQLELARGREAMDSLRRRIEDDFGLVAFDYNAEVSGPKPLPFDGMVEQLPVVKELPQEFEDNISRQRSMLRRMGAINPEAQQEFREVKDRYEFLKSQVEDLKKADADLRQVIIELDELMQKEFLKTFTAVAIEFKQNFSRLFGGGSAHLVLMDEEHPAEGGVDIEARLPGRREQGLSLLSGGERSLTAVALIFSLLKVSPTPFCVMDEVDAMLDEANVGRFRELLSELSKETQFIIITHNRNTVQAADVIYGVTMGRDSASQIVSLKLDEVGEDMAK